MRSSTRTPASAVVRLLTAGVAVLIVLAMTLAPRNLVARGRHAFMTLLEATGVPVVPEMSSAQLEGPLNALLFVPLGAALAVLLGRRLWVLAPLVGWALSLAVELTQDRIPGRVFDAQDILWNTAGTALGAVIAAILARTLRRAEPRPPRGRTRGTREAADARADDPQHDIVSIR